MSEHYLVFNKAEALYFANHLGYTVDDIERAEKSNDGLIKRIKQDNINDGTLPVYISRKIPTTTK